MMESLPLSFSVSPSHTSAILIKKMLDRDYAVTGASTSTPVTHTEFDDSAPVPSLPKRTLPLSPRQAFAKRLSRSTASRRSVRGKPQPRALQKNVLVVDDVHDVTEMIALFLKHAGYQVTTADSASSALQLAGERNFDLIISDIGMPGMNGYELAGTLRRLAEYQSIPIIAVTGFSEYDDRGRALQAGFSAHLTKPIDPAQLLDLMNELLG
jgi:CheY-like chemotaxis protein